MIQSDQVVVFDERTLEIDDEQHNVENEQANAEQKVENEQVDRMYVFVLFIDQRFRTESADEKHVDHYSFNLTQSDVDRCGDRQNVC